MGLMVSSLALLVPRALPQQSSGGDGEEPENLSDPRAMEFYGNARTVVNLPLEEAIRRIPHLRGLEPAERQDELAGILAETGKSVHAFFHDFPNTACDEKVYEENQFNGGMFQPGHSEKFRYLALNRPTKAVVGLEEFRTDSEGNLIKPSGSFTTVGFVSMEAVFHPEYQSESEFRLLGRQRVKGHETYVVGFAQIPGKARIVGKATLGPNGYVLTLVQGAAWIDSKNYQVVRMVTELLAPRPDIGLKVQSTDLTYEQVHFKSGAKALWLPHEVVVTEKAQDVVYRSIHTYSNFRLFRVEAGGKTLPP